MASDPTNSSADSEDEDLFGFPSVLQAASGPDLEATAASAKADPEASEAVEVGGDFSDEDILGADDLLETLDNIDALAMEGELPDFETLTADTPILGEEPLDADSVPAPIPSAQAGISLDGELDEDLFGFDGHEIQQLSDDLSIPGASADEDDDVEVDYEDDDLPTLDMDDLLEESSPKVAPLADLTATGSSDTEIELEKTVKTPNRPAPKTSSPLVERNVSPASGEPTLAPQPGPVRNLDMPEQPQFEGMPATNTAMVPMGQDGSGRGRLIEILAVGFLVINTGLVLLAWRAGDNFQETLLTVARTIGGAVNQRPAMAGNYPGPIQLDLPPAVQPVEQETNIYIDADVQPVEELDAEHAPIEEIKPEPEKVELGVDIEGLPRMVLNDVISQLESGKHEAARRSLFHMIGNRDRFALPDEIVDEAEILIARSYQLQGAALKAAKQ